MKHLPFLKTIALIILISLCFPGYSKNGNNAPFFFSLNYRTGENVPHKPAVKNLTYPYRGVDLKIGWQTLGNEDWQRAFRYPCLGVGVNWNTFKTEVLGNPLAIYYFTNFPQFYNSWFRFDLEVNFGLSYGIHPYNEITNPTNMATGSTFNSFFGLYLEQSFHITKQVDLFFCEGLTHYSNGALGTPNYGLNIPSLKVGVRYLNKPPLFIRNIEKPKFERNFSIITYLGAGTKKMDKPTPSYNEVLISPALFYRSGFKRRVGLGFEVAYNEAIKWLSHDPGKIFTIEELLTYGIYLSHEFVIKRFTILSQFGVYLKNQPSDKFYFERLGFGYYFGKDIRIVLNVKAHYIKAEYMELGLAYDLNFK